MALPSASSRRSNRSIRQISAVQIVDAAIAHKGNFGRVKIHQTIDRGAAKGAFRGGALGVVVGAIVAGPAGAAVAGAAGGVLAGLHNKFHDIGIDDKWMRTGREGNREGQQRPVRPVRRRLGLVDRGDPGCGQVEQGAAYREHPLEQRRPWRFASSLSQRPSSSEARKSLSTLRWKRKPSPTT